MALTATMPAAKAQEKLTFATITTEEMSLIAKQWEAPLAFLGDKLGVKIEYYATTSYAAVVEAMMGGFVDVALLSPEIYILAHEKAPYIVPTNGLARPATTFLKEPCACYHSLLITKRAGDFPKIQDLKGAVLALTDPASTSGSRVPRAFFPDANEGQGVDQYFGQIFYAGAHDAAAKAVLAGRADAAFVSDNALSRGIDRGVFAMDSFNVIWSSPKIPAMPITVNTKTVSPEMTAKLQTLLAGLKDDPEGQGVLKQLNATELPVADNAMFDPLRTALKDADKSGN